MNAIECASLSKVYGSFRAVNAISLEVQPGEIFGFLGPNGAGKTTTIRMLMGMLIPSQGQARILGLDCQKDRVEVKRRVGYLPDNPVFQDYLRGVELLQFVGEMHGLSGQLLVERVTQLLGQFSLTDAAYEFAVNYSMGMKRKLGLACAQIHDPDVYILDEPTNGLDPIAQREVQNWITSSAQAGKTIFLSTHLLDMAEKLCHRVAIIHQGEILTVGSPQQLKNQLSAGGSLEEVFFAVTRAED
ncbi:MAG TPA: ABC transporter ATP-binding protein [Acidobacteriota bacterium]|nr:ABC transporter ATP-binding protein [Acidobacteriota bacterium]HNB71517.1 ABC transporter ATP-binding protein [Acidobacteriota bacterium]HNC43721.1 ABC transporter ATP-binding protein [Acidobacteriota bacterium]HND19330.1 ABC transporter ATP-binding protein [Acidobacteriota bacterium]HNG92028.1 ABC transporter ATP-binding protein [Acidobacteriota bacterium]